MDPDPVVTAPGQVGKFDERIIIEPEIVFSAETHLGPPALGFYLVALDDGHVDDTRFRPLIAGSRDDDIPLDIGEPDKAPAVVISVLGESADRQKNQGRNQQGCLFHLSSPCTLV
jgi:hypothetical protein